MDAYPKAVTPMGYYQYFVADRANIGWRHGGLDVILFIAIFYAGNRVLAFLLQQFFDQFTHSVTVNLFHDLNLSGTVDYRECEQPQTYQTRL